MFLRRKFYISLFLIAVVATLGVWFPVFYYLALVATGGLMFATLTDIIMLLRCKVEGQREMSTKLDLGESNNVKVVMKVIRGKIRGCTLVDELPNEFKCEADEWEMEPVQLRDGNGFYSSYTVSPIRRGAYHLGRLLVFLRCLDLVERRVKLQGKGLAIDVYPAFSHLRDKEQQARMMQSIQNGCHKRQHPSNQTEFMDIRDYVAGDDIRTINWKATARIGHTMVNNYEEERSQHIINIIDCGRTMHRTFDGLTLQDYAINASLLLSYTALDTEGDCMGLATFGPTGIKFLPPRPGDKQLKSIMHQLYSLETEYGEGDLEEMCLMLDRRMQRRSLVVLYTDYATVEAMERQLPFLRRIANRHCLVVVNFADYELQALAEQYFDPKSDYTTTQHVQRSIATDLMHQKLLVSDKLSQVGIHSVMLRPQDLSFAIVRKYLELKSRGAW